MTTPIPLVYFDKGKAPRVVGPMAPDPMDIIEHQGIISWLRHPPSGSCPLRIGETASPAMVEAVLRAFKRPTSEKAVHAAENAPPVAQVPRPPPSLPPKPPPSPEAVRLASEALRDYLRLHDRGGHLAPWLRDGKRHRVVDARDQAYARGDAATRAVAGALLALTREQLEAVRQASGVSADIGRVKPEGET